jgi:hypothetical protein
MKDEGGILKLVLLGVAGYLAYQWLQSSGLWAQWFGGNSFTSTSQLLAYCQANPTGTASFNGQSAPCSSWLQAASGAAQPAASSSAPAPSSATSPSPAAGPISTPTVSPSLPAKITPLTVAQLLNAVAQSGSGATAATTFNVDQWNYYVTTYIDPTAIVDVDLSAAGYVSGAPLTAQQYISLRQSVGLSGIPAGIGTYRNPYSWRM